MSDVKRKSNNQFKRNNNKRFKNTNDNKSIGFENNSESLDSVKIRNTGESTGYLIDMSDKSSDESSDKSSNKSSNKSSDESSDESSNESSDKYLNKLFNNSSKLEKYQKDNLNTGFKNELDKIQTIIKQRKITLNKILSLDTSIDKKMQIYQLFKILKNTQKNTEEYHKLENKIISIIESSEKLSESDILIEKQLELTKYKPNDLYKNILSCDNILNIKQMLYSKYQEMINYSKNSEEYLKLFKWINTVLSIPTKPICINYTNITDQISSIKQTLDSNLYGLDKCKERIVEIFCKMASNPNCNNKCISLNGPPGIGKTAIAKYIAQALNIPFAEIPCGNIDDPNCLIGHSSTYIGSKPGLITNALIQMKCNNGLLLLDEIDKIGNNQNYGINIDSILMNILGDTQNTNFIDQYMPEISIDLSHLIIIVTTNNYKTLSKPLIDRLPIIEIPKYNIDEKIRIGVNYILPKKCNAIGIDKTDLVIDDDTMRYIINKYANNEDGVRELDRVIGTITERVNMLVICNANNCQYKPSYFISDFKLPIILNNNLVSKLLI